MTKRIEPRTQVSDAALASGDRNAWRQILGFPPDKPKCPSCHTAAEQWWSYCAMCGWHIAGGERR
jgi:ribosomal protein L37AE/L43A